jgi:hypothetical protein
MNSDANVAINALKGRIESLLAENAVGANANQALHLEVHERETGTMILKKDLYDLKSELNDAQDNIVELQRELVVIIMHLKLLVSFVPLSYLFII